MGNLEKELRVRGPGLLIFGQHYPRATALFVDLLLPFALCERTSSMKQGFIAPQLLGQGGREASGLVCCGQEASQGLPLSCHLLLLSPPLYRCGHREQGLLVCARAQTGCRPPRTRVGGWEGGL